MTDNIYIEKISSNRTEALFLILTTICLLLAAWQWHVARIDGFTITFICLFGFFLFYALNYRTLIIHLNSTSLVLKFGFITWKIPFENIESCTLDKLPAFQRLGGAGIHFMFVNGRYRANFNFLEYPRVVIGLKVKQGPIRDISFSTRQPDKVISFITTGNNIVLVKRELISGGM